MADATKGSSNLPPSSGTPDEDKSKVLNENPISDVPVSQSTVEIDADVEEEEYFDVSEELEDDPDEVYYDVEEVDEGLEALADSEAMRDGLVATRQAEPEDAIQKTLKEKKNFDVERAAIKASASADVEPKVKEITVDPRLMEVYAKARREGKAEAQGTFADYLKETHKDAKDLGKNDFLSISVKGTVGTFEYDGLDLSGGDFTGCYFDKIEFISCDLTGASFSDCDLRSVVFEDTILSKVDFRGADFGGMLDRDGHPMSGCFIQYDENKDFSPLTSQRYLDGMIFSFSDMEEAVQNNLVPDGFRYYIRSHHTNTVYDPTYRRGSAGQEACMGAIVVTPSQEDFVDYMNTLKEKHAGDASKGPSFVQFLEGRNATIRREIYLKGESAKEALESKIKELPKPYRMIPNLEGMDLEALSKEHGWGAVKGLKEHVQAMKAELGKKEYKLVVKVSEDQFKAYVNALKVGSIEPHTHITAFLRSVEGADYPIDVDLVADMSGMNIATMARKEKWGEVEGLMGKVNLSGSYLKDAMFSTMNIEGMDLSYAYLEHAQFAKVVAHNVNLKGANITRANFEKAQMQHANLNYVLGDRANFKKVLAQGAEAKLATLRAIDLEDGHFASAQMERVDLGHAHGAGASFRKAHLKKANISNAAFEEADFTEAQLENALLAGMKGMHAKFDNAKLNYANLVGVDFSNASFLNADLSMADFRKAVAQEANFQAANLRKALLDEAQMAKANFVEALMEDVLARRANFKEALMNKVKAEGIDLTEADLREIEAKAAHFEYGIMKKANMEAANFEASYLNYVDAEEAHAKKAIFTKAMMKGANFRKANLEKARLDYADCEDMLIDGASLWGADLYKAKNADHIAEEKAKQQTFLGRLWDGYTYAGHRVSDFLDDALHWGEATKKFFVDLYKNMQWGLILGAVVGVIILAGVGAATALSGGTALAVIGAITSLMIPVLLGSTTLGALIATQKTLSDHHGSLGNTTYRIFQGMIMGGIAGIAGGAFYSDLTNYSLGTILGAGAVGAVTGGVVGAASPTASSEDGPSFSDRVRSGFKVGIFSGLATMFVMVAHNVYATIRNIVMGFVSGVVMGGMSGVWAAYSDMSTRWAEESEETQKQLYNDRKEAMIEEGRKRDFGNVPHPQDHVPLPLREKSTKTPEKGDGPSATLSAPHDLEKQEGPDKEQER